MKQFDLHFWLDEQGPENGWRVSLPYCPICEPGYRNFLRNCSLKDCSWTGCPEPIGVEEIRFC